MNAKVQNRSSELTEFGIGGFVRHRPQRRVHTEVTEVIVRTPLSVRFGNGAALLYTVRNELLPQVVEPVRSGPLLSGRTIGADSSIGPVLKYVGEYCI